jgi:hypothetical protein
VQTPRDFKEIVDEDYRDYKLDPINLRLAYHLALGLFHLRDWTFWQYSGDPSFPFSSRGGDYQKFLEQQSSDFGYMRDLANAVKHADLDPKKKPSTQMVGLANTEVSSAAFQTGVFQEDAFQTRIMIISHVRSRRPSSLDNDFPLGLADNPRS